MLLVEDDDKGVSVIAVKDGLASASLVRTSTEGLASLGASSIEAVSEVALVETDSSVTDALVAAPPVDDAADDDGMLGVVCGGWSALEAEACGALVSVAVGVFVTMSSKTTLQLSTMAAFVFP